MPARANDLELRADLRNHFDKSYASRDTGRIDSCSVVPLNESERSLRVTAGIRFRTRPATRTRETT